MTMNIETNKRAGIVVLFAAVLIATATVVNAVGGDTNSPTNLWDQSQTNATTPAISLQSESSIPAGTFRTVQQTNQSILVSAVLKAPAESEECGVTGTQMTDSSTNTLFNTQTLVVCCKQTKTFGDTINFRTDVLAATPSDASAHKTVRFFRDAVISVGRAARSVDRGDREAGAFNEFPANVSWAGDSVARIEPRGLKLFSWSW